MGIDGDIELLTRGELKAVIRQLRTHIREHRDQRADDRCWMDDEKLYESTLPEKLTYDRRVGDPLKMVENCKRFVKTHCEGGHWTSYADLEAFIKGLVARGCKDNVFGHPGNSCMEVRQHVLDGQKGVTDDVLLDYKQGTNMCLACKAKLVLEEGIVA